jgi:hypothetical protein
MDLELSNLMDRDADGVRGWTADKRRKHVEQMMCKDGVKIFYRCLESAYSLHNFDTDRAAARAVLERKLEIVILEQEFQVTLEQESQVNFAAGTA